MPTCNTLCFEYPNNEDEKRQYNAVRVPSSQYTNVLASFTSGASALNPPTNVKSDTSDQPGKRGVSIKNDSYIRFLNKKKASAMRQRTAIPAIVPPNNVTNNKRNKNGVGILSERCGCK
jgi:hypothetical protein